jgi:hypothetical protein
MKRIILSGFVLLASLAGVAQTAGSAKAGSVAEAKSYKSELGYSFAYPQDWVLMDTGASLPEVKQQAAEAAKSDEGKQSANCAQMDMTLRHVSASGMIVAMALPFACYGQRLPPEDLAGFGASVASGLSQPFDIQFSLTKTFHSGSHDLWVERDQATAKADFSQSFIVETVCGLLNKAAVCWVGIVKDGGDLATFEQGQITLDGDKPTALVPAGVFTAGKQ